MRVGVMVAACAAVNAPIDIADAQTLDFAALQAAQGAGNSKAGPRIVPAKVLPIPSDLDPATAMLVAAPYSLFWNLNAPDDAGWREIVKQFDAAGMPELAKGRAALGVTIEPTTLGGVKAFILTPKEIPKAYKNQLVFNLHGGGYIFGAGESGTTEAMLMPAFGGYKVVAIDYRMPPDTPYPAGMDDATAAWRAVAVTMDPRRIAVEGFCGRRHDAFAYAAGQGGRAATAGRYRSRLAASRPDEHRRYPQDQRMGRQRLVSIDAPYPKGVSQLYAHGQDLKDPQLSPIYGDFHGMPPPILTTGTRDLFLSDTVRVHRKLRRAGVVAELQVYEGLSQAQYLFDPTLTVPSEVFGEIARFFDGHLAR
jgi:epsilon-lactone hydrolase